MSLPLLWMGLHLAAGPALGADLVVAAGPQISVRGGDAAGEAGLGHNLSFGRPISERWVIELSSSSATGEGGPPAFGVFGGARAYLTRPWSPDGALALTAALGVDLLSPGPVATLGLGYDLPLRGRFTARVGAGWALGTDSKELSSGANAAISVLVPPRPRREFTTRAAATTAPMQAVRALPQLSVEPATALVWVPHPVCAWMSPEEANLVLAELGDAMPADAELVVAAEGYTDAHVHVDGPTVAHLQPVTAQGALLLLANPGDHLTIDGHDVPTGPDGAAVINAPEGRVGIEVKAGGQRQEYKAAIANGFAVWVRVRPPPPTAVLFTVRSAEVSPKAQAEIAALAENAADWSFVLQGAYSYEGSLNFNRRLALERAAAVGKLLEAAGIPADRIAYLDPPNADPNGDPTTQRACKILAVPPERSP